MLTAHFSCWKEKLFEAICKEENSDMRNYCCVDDREEDEDEERWRKGRRGNREREK